MKAVLLLVVIVLLADETCLAQWYTDADNPPRTFPSTDLGVLIADSAGGAYFFSVFGLADPNLMHVQMNGQWDNPYPGVYLGGRDTEAPVRIVDSENNFVIDIEYFWGDIGLPRLPNHLVKVSPTGQFLWDYAFPDTNTLIRTMVGGVAGRVQMEIMLRVPDSTGEGYDYPRYLQIFDSSGNPTLDWDEVPLCENVASEIFLGDGSGGAIYAWIPDTDTGACELRLQHIDAAGNLLYPSEGLNVPAQSISRFSRMANAYPDGFLVSYPDPSQNTWGWVRVNFEGEVQWSSLLPEGYPTQAVAPDQHGGAFLIHYNSELLGRISGQGGYVFNPLYVGPRAIYSVSSSSGMNVGSLGQDSAWILQRYDTLGQPQWAEPIVVFNLPPVEWIESRTIACDAAGGTIIGFYRRWGYPEGRGWYFTRVDAEGNLGSSVFVPERNFVPNEFHVTAYPNPFNSTVCFDWNENIRRNIEVRIFNIIGQEIRQWVFNNSYCTRLLWDG